MVQAPFLGPLAAWPVVHGSASCCGLVSVSVDGGVTDVNLEGDGFEHEVLLLGTVTIGEELGSSAGPVSSDTLATVPWPLLGFAGFMLNCHDFQLQTYQRK